MTDATSSQHWLHEALHYSASPWLPRLHRAPAEEGIVRSLCLASPADDEPVAWYTLEQPRADPGGFNIEQVTSDGYRIRVSGEEDTLLVGPSGELPPELPHRVWIICGGAVLETARLCGVRDLALISFALVFPSRDRTPALVSRIRAAGPDPQGRFLREALDVASRIEGLERLRIWADGAQAPQVDISLMQQRNSLRELHLSKGVKGDVRWDALLSLTSLSVDGVASADLERLGNLVALRIRESLPYPPSRLHVHHPRLQSLDVRMPRPFDDWKLPTDLKEATVKSIEPFVPWGWKGHAHLEELLLVVEDELADLRSLGTCRKLRRLRMQQQGHRQALRCSLSPLASLPDLEYLELSGFTHLSDARELLRSRSLRRLTWEPRRSDEDGSTHAGQDQCYLWAASIEASALANRGDAPSAEDFERWLRAVGDAASPDQLEALSRALWSRGPVQAQGGAARELADALLRHAVLTHGAASSVLKHVPLSEPALATSWLDLVAQLAPMLPEAAIWLLSRAAVERETLPEHSARRLLERLEPLQDHDPRLRPGIAGLWERLRHHERADTCLLAAESCGGHVGPTARMYVAAAALVNGDAPRARAALPPHGEGDAQVVRKGARELLARFAFGVSTDVFADFLGADTDEQPMDTDERPSRSIEALFDALPFPIGSVAWAYYSAHEPQRKFDYLLKFFQATAELFATVLLSGFVSDAARYAVEFAPPLLRAVAGSAPSHPAPLERTSFGSWLGIVENLSARGRRELGTTNAIDIRRMFADATLTDLAHLFDKAILDELRVANSVRNLQAAHAGARGGVVEEERLRSLEGHLHRLLGAMSSLWDRAEIVRPVPRALSFANGRFRATAYRLRRHAPPFPTLELGLDHPLEDGRLYVYFHDADRALTLLPLIRFGPHGTPGADACYFYDRLGPEGGRFVSYHYEYAPEMHVDRVEVMSMLRRILPGGVTQ